MRPKGSKGRRWSALTQSPRYEETALFRRHANWVREFLREEQLPEGLSPENYLRQRVDRLRRFDEIFEALVRQGQEEINTRDEAVLAGADRLAELPLSQEILLVSDHVWSGFLREAATRPDVFKQIDPRGFEELVAYLFGEFGYEVELTQRTRDGGRDIVAVKKAEVSARYLIECKHPPSGATIGIRPVRELYAVKVDEGATKAILATTSHFSRDAQVFFERHKWELEPRDFDGVMRWVAQYQVCR